MAFREDIIPNKLELLLYAILAAVITFFGNFSYFTNQLFGTTAGTHQSLGEMFHIFLGDLLMFLDGLSFTATTAVFIFWSLAGIAAFSLLQSMYNTYIEIKNDIRVSVHFLHPRNYSNMRFWFGVLLQMLAHVTTCLFIAVCLLLLAFVLIPVALTLSVAFFSDASIGDGIALISAFLLLMFGLAVFGQAIQLLFRRRALNK